MIYFQCRFINFHRFQEYVKPRRHYSRETLLHIFIDVFGEFPFNKKIGCYKKALNNVEYSGNKTFSQKAVARKCSFSSFHLKFGSPFCEKHCVYFRNRLEIIFSRVNCGSRYALATDTTPKYNLKLFSLGQQITISTVPNYTKSLPSYGVCNSASAGRGKREKVRFIRFVETLEAIVVRNVVFIPGKWLEISFYRVNCGSCSLRPRWTNNYYLVGNSQIKSNNNVKRKCSIWVYHNVPHFHVRLFAIGLQDVLPNFLWAHFNVPCTNYTYWRFHFFAMSAYPRTQSHMLIVKNFNSFLLLSRSFNSLIDAII